MYYLKWKDQFSSAIKNFSKLRNDPDYFDVTLVSDDHQLVHAHKLILSSSSDYFKDILKPTKNNQNTMICMEGTTLSDLNNILDYVYNGEVQVPESQLDRFLQIGERWKVDGLKDRDNTKSSMMKISSSLDVPELDFEMAERVEKEQEDKGRVKKEPVDNQEPLLSLPFVSLEPSKPPSSTSMSRLPTEPQIGRAHV